MPHIEYLGFVVRQEREVEKAPENIVAACVVKFKEPEDKKMWKVYPLGKTKFISMLFAISVLIREKLARLPVPDMGISEDGILLKKPDPRYDFMLSYLFDVWKKSGRYEAVYEDLRHATRFFFRPYGTKNTVRLQAPQDGMYPSNIFFWTVSDFKKNTSLKDLPITPTELINVEDPPQSNQDILPGISGLAEKVRLYLAEPKSWQELYKKALMPPENMPKYQIPLYGLEVKTNEQKQDTNIYEEIYEEQHLQLTEMLVLHKKILMTGPSGSGKTTIQKMLMAEFLGAKPPISGCIPIFVSLKYVGAEKKSVTDLIVNTVVQVILESNLLKPILQQQVDIRKAHCGDYTNLESLFAQEVKKFLTSTGNKCDSDIVLLLDGYNEIPEAELFDTEHNIQELADRVDYIVVSNHSYDIPSFKPRFVRFELDELSDKQIVSYLNLQLKDKGEQFFKDKLKENGRILSMARTPFYLELIVEYHTTYPERKLPMCPGHLLKFFIQKQYEKKINVRKLRFSDISIPEIDFFLRNIAYALINRGKEKAQTVFYYPDDLSDIFPLSAVPNSSKIAKAAELIGFLDKSGQISEESGAPGIISFKQDSIRDYFAAQEFKIRKVFDNPITVESYLEYTKWDNVWLLLLGLIEDENDFIKALSTIAKLDPLFSSNCLTASAIANKRHANYLLSYFDLSRISLLTSRADEDFPNKSDCALDEIIYPALSRIYSLYPARELSNLYSRQSTSKIIKAAIPEALKYAAGEQANDYYEQILKESGPKSPYKLFDFFKECRSLKTYKLLAETYIRALKENSERCWCLSSCLESVRCYIPIKVLLELEEHYYKICKNLTKWPLVSPLMCPLEQGLSGKTEDWLRLRNHPDPYVSTAARKALFINKHPTSIVDIVNDCKALKPRDFGNLQKDYYQAFLESGESGTKQLLLQILKKELKQDEVRYRNLALNIVCLLLEHKDKTIITELVKLGLQGEDYQSLMCLSICLKEVPKEVERIVHIEMISKKYNSRNLMRARIALAICGDKTMKKYIVRAYKETESLYYKEPNVMLDGGFLYGGYFKLLCIALVTLGINEYMPILERIASNGKHPLFWDASNLLLDLGYERPPENRDPVELIKLIKSSHQEIDKYMIAELNHSLSRLPFDKYKTIIANILEIAEKAISKGKKDLAQGFYWTAEHFRDKYPTQRFLDIFAGWPTIPHKYHGTL